MNCFLRAPFDGQNLVAELGRPLKFFLGRVGPHLLLEQGDGRLENPLPETRSPGPMIAMVFLGRHHAPRTGPRTG